MPNNYVFDYDASDLRATIYGQTSGGTLTSVLVDDAGRVVVTGDLNNVIAGHATATSTTALTVNSTGFSLWPETGVDVSQDTMVTFAVYPSSDLRFKIQVSPDGVTYWKDDTAATVVQSGNLATLVTKTYLRYAAIAYQAAVDTSSLIAWYQTQS